MLHIIMRYWQRSFYIATFTFKNLIRCKPYIDVRLPTYETVTMAFGGAQEKKRDPTIYVDSE